MIESFLGTMFLCIIIISLALSFIQYIGIKVNIKTYEPEIIYIGDYVQSIIIWERFKFCVNVKNWYKICE